MQLLQKEVESLNSQLRQKELQVEEFHRDIAKTADSLKDKDNEIAKAVGHKMQNALIQEQKIQEARKTVENAKIKMLRFYDVDRFESNYLADAV